jgi:inosine/xanthosine triphosphatase
VIRVAREERAVVATGNEMKVRAAKKAFSMIGITRVERIDAETGIPPQPIGLEETLIGALKRSIHAWRNCEGCFGAGVESGLLPYPSPTGYIIQQVAVVVSPDGKVSLGTSQGFELYSHEANIVSTGTELSKVASSYRKFTVIKENLGYIGYMTHGIVTRFDLTVQAFLMALKPWIHGDTSNIPLLEDYLERIRDIFGIDL